MQDQAFLGPESGLAVPDGEGGVDLYIATQWLHVDRDQLAREPRPAAGEGAAHAGRRRRRVRRPRGPLDADPRVPARAAHRPAGEDGLQPRGVVLRPRPPPPVHGCATSTARRATASSSTCARGSCSTAAPTPRRSTAVVSNAACFAAGPYDVPNARIDGYVDLHEQPAVRRDARLRRGAGRASPTRRRWTGSRPRSGMDPVELRIRNAMRAGLAHADRPGRSRSRRRSPSCSSACARCRCRPSRAADGARPARAARRRRRTRPTARASRRGVGYARRLQERRLLRGLRRLLDRARAPVDATAASRSSRSTPPPPRSARASSRCRRRSRAPSSASSASRCSTADTRVGSAGSSSASRQTYVTGGAVKAACEAVRERVLALAAERLGGPSPSRSTRSATALAGGARRRRRRGDGRVAPPRDLPARRERPGRRAPAVRVLRPPRRRRRRLRARARARRRARHGAGGRQGDEPAGARGPDRGRHRPGPRARADRGDPGRATARCSTRRSPTT